MKKILIADRDESLKDAFRVVFPGDEFEILFTPNGKEVEKLAAEYRPEIYIINVSLEKKDGVDVYKDLKEKNMLQNVRFFFMKDESLPMDFSGFPIEGVIEKPINFFKVHQMIDREEVLPDLRIAGAKKMEEKRSPQVESFSPPPKEKTTVLETERATSLENELRKILYDSIENVKMGIVDRLTPIISQYIQEHARKILDDAAEKVIRDEMERLLNVLRESRR